MEETQADGKTSHVLEQMDIQKSNLSILEKTWAELFNRITPLLREPDPDKKESETKLSRQLAPLAVEIRDSNDRIYLIVKQIETTLERLEL